MEEEISKPILSNIIVATRKENNVGEIVTEYPSELGEDERILAKYMIPKGELKAVDYTFFYLGKKVLANITKPSDEPKRRRATTVSKLHEDATSRNTLEILVYTFSDDLETPNWEMLGSDYLVAYLGSNRIDIIDDSDQAELAVIEPHFELQYTEMEPLFVAVAMPDGSALGVRFKSDTDEESFMMVLESMCSQMAQRNGLGIEELQKKYTGPVLYCYSAIQNEFAIAFCCTCPYVEILKPILEVSLVEYTKVPKASTLQYIYETLNNFIKIPLPKPASFVLFDQNFTISPPPPLNTRDQISQYSIRHLISIFKVGIMDIYNFVLFDRRVVFVGQRCAARDICNCVISSAMLVAPLIVAEYRAFPFTSIASKFFRQESFIAGLDDPAIIQQPENWDILCNIDTGTIQFSSFSPIKKESHDYQSICALDSEFFAKIYRDFKCNLSESSLQTKFRNYTRRILDIANNLAYFPSDAEKEMEEKTQRFRLGILSNTAVAAAYALSLETRAIKQRDIFIALQRLVKSPVDISEKDLIGIFNLLQPYTNSQEKIDELSTAMRDYCCLDALGMTVIHPSEAVKKSAKSFLYSMKLFQNQSMLNPFFRNAYQRLNAASNR